ncbi:E3 ubiquitin-protein ligase LRSAM1-like isoform X2 [Euwallacea similis]|uniref:E3 ubiquitin-protein ligase LRSAM1-like isoform X2 n=1 Tax=Euwallacea similis TaxID=1736056 RepID=UPI00344E762B
MVVSELVSFVTCDIVCTMFRRKKSCNKKLLEHKLYLARENPEPDFDISSCDLSEIPNGIYSLCRVFLKQSLILNKNHLSSLSGGGDLKDLSGLKVLNISHNEFEYLPSDIGLLTNLEEFYLDNNKLKSLPNSLCNLVNLKCLGLSSNKLKLLPEDIGNLSSLKMLNLEGNDMLKQLPKSICKAKLLSNLCLDSENFVYPPSNVVANGLEALMDYICNDVGIEYTASSEELVDRKQDSDLGEIGKPDHFQEKICELERKKLKKAQEFLEIEKNNDLMQRQEIEMANVHKANRQKLLATISQRQSKFDSALNRFQQGREAERFRLIEHLQEAENYACTSINNLLKLSKEPVWQLLEKEEEEKKKLLSAVDKYNADLHKTDILAAMQDILKQETELFNKYNKNKTETSRSILELELETDTKLAHILKGQEAHKANLVQNLVEDTHLQKAAVSTLLERGDARSWGLLQQVRLVESQLAALTTIELDRRKLKIDEHLNELAEQRVNLSILLMDLLEQQRERRSQLLSTLQTMEDSICDNSEDFWLRQYQQLLEKLPQGLSHAQKNIDPRLAEMLLANGVLHCLPFLAKLTQSQSNTKSITELDLIEAGIRIPFDRQKILDSLHAYSKEQISCNYIPSAPAAEENEASAPPLLDDIKAITTVECVICLDIECQVIFVPCGHFCCCFNCSGPVQKCPLCRTNIERKVTMLFQ